MKKIIAIGILMISLGCKNNKTSSSKLLGLWKLESMKVCDSTTNTWSNYKGGMDGYLLYDENGHVALHLYEKGYEKYSFKVS